MSKRKKKENPYVGMTAVELAAATKDLNEEFAIRKARPLDAAESKQWHRAKRIRR